MKTPVKLQENWQDWKEYSEGPRPEQMCGQQFKEQELSDQARKSLQLFVIRD